MIQSGTKVTGEDAEGLISIAAKETRIMVSKEEEPKGFGSERSEPLKTWRGLVLYYCGDDVWKVDYPDDDWTGKYKRYGGGTTTPKVMSLVYYLAKGHPISRADWLAFARRKRRKRTR